MEFSRQEYWSQLLFHSPEGLHKPETETVPLESPLLVGGFFTTVPPGKPLVNIYTYIYIYNIIYYIMYYTIQYII